MPRRTAYLIICLFAAAVCCTASAAEDNAELSARARVTAYAQSIHEYVWTLPEEEGVILLYNWNYYPRTNGNRLVFGHQQPYVVYGTVRGVPYSLSAYGNGRETPFAKYLQLTNAERSLIANIYTYLRYGDRVSMRYGMSCTTFLTECLQQGFSINPPPILHGARNFLSDVRWKRYFTFGKHGRKDFPDLQAADFLRNDTHVMLVMDNDTVDRRLEVMEQTQPTYAMENCEHLTDVTVTLMYRGKPTVVQAKRLCMECSACRQATTGTQRRWAGYDELADEGYLAVFVKY